MGRAMTDEYRQGLQDGKITAIEEMQRKQNDRLDDHVKRLSSLEKTSYIVLGMVLLLQALPWLQKTFGG